MTKRRIHAEPRRYWTEADDAQVIAQYPHMPTATIAAMLDRGVSAIYRRAQLLGLTKTPEYFASHASGRTDGRRGAASRFPKGHVPANKGLRRPGWGPGRMKSTQFKPKNLTGQAAHNFKEVGTFRTNSEGYRDVKVDNTRKGAQAWVALHRLNWIGIHGPIPRGYMLRFIDGNCLNPVVENLMLVTRKQHLALNWHDRFPKEIKQLTQLQGAIRRQINKRTAP